MKTPEQAKILWCPMGRTGTPAIGGMNDNRSEYLRNNCIANKCAMWRWADGADGLGYCGLAPLQQVAA